LSSRLTRLVEAENQPELYLYVATQLNDFPDDGTFWNQRIGEIRRQMIERLFPRLFDDKAHPALEKAVPGPLRDLIARRGKIQGFLQINRLQKERELLEALLRQLLRENPDVLRERLTDRNPAIRFLTIQAIARRRLPLERALIERLVDRDPAVIQAARAALVRLGRGVDFGPAAKATRTQRYKAVERWTEWLALQEKISLPAGQHRRSGVAQAEMLPRPSTEPEASPRLSMRGK
jgi:hypothetical protein